MEALSCTQKCSANVIGTLVCVARIWRKVSGLGFNLLIEYAWATEFFLWCLVGIELVC